MQSASARFLYYSLWVPIRQEGFSANSANYLHHQDALLSATPTESQAYICVKSDDELRLQNKGIELVPCQSYQERHSLCCFLVIIAYWSICSFERYSQSVLHCKIKLSVLS
jgi:hypothetical protein